MKWALSMLLAHSLRGRERERETYGWGMDLSGAGTEKWFVVWPTNRCPFGCYDTKNRKK